MSERTISHESLYSFVKQVMLKCSVPEDAAHYVADNLVLSSLRGIDSQGVGRVKRYVDRREPSRILCGVQSGAAVHGLR